MVYRDKNNPNSHLTVKEREKPSFPAKIVSERGLIKGNVLDFGCGLGKDLNYFRNKGFEVTGYDPHYAPDYPDESFDTILCFYVLNVLLPEEQADVLMAVSELLKPDGSAYYAVRRDIKRNGFRYNPKREIAAYQCNVKLPFRSIFRNKYCEIYEYRRLTDAATTGGTFELLTESATAYAGLINDGATPYAFVRSKRDAGDYFQLSLHEQRACWLVVNRVKWILERRFGAQSNNVNFSAGQGADSTHTITIEFE